MVLGSFLVSTFMSFFLLRHQKVYGNEALYSSGIELKCRDGFHKVGTRNMSSGGVSFEIPDCKPLCPNPEVPNGNIVNPSLPIGKHGSSVTFRCNDKYVLQGQKTLECQEGRWSGEIPTCLAPCKNPGVPSGGIKYGTSYKHGEQVKFKCKKGKALHGAGILTCNNGAWDHDTPKCMKRCLNPGVPNNGYPKKPMMRFATTFKHGTVMTFLCNDIYTLHGQQTIECVDGRWSHEIPKCFGACYSPWFTNSTPKPPLRLDQKSLHGANITFSCRESYTLDGPSVIYCLNGRWSDSVPVCKDFCQDPGNIVNGYKTNSWGLYLSGDKVTYRCNPGYDMVGKAELLCNADGHWNDKAPVCYLRCPDPGVPKNGYPKKPMVRFATDFKHGTVRTFLCNDNHKLHGQQTIECVDGQWSHEIPKCFASCSKSSDIPNGQKTGDSYEHGHNVTYSCSENSTFVGSSSITCNDGNWVPHQRNQWPSCKKTCSDPGAPSKGSKSGSDYRHGKQVSYTCENGTQMIGESSSICNDGKWSNVRPACLKICQDPGNIINGYKTDNVGLYLSGDRVTYRCNPGYDMVGKAELLCNDDGHWNDKAPVCYGQCKVPGNFTGVQSKPSVNPDEYLSHRKRINFYCTKGKQLTGVSETVCDDGSWSKHFPTCLVHCNNPGKIENGRSESTNLTAKFQCDQGYSLVGSSLLNCVEGKWKPDPPRCHKDCDNPGQPRNGRLNSTDFRHGKGVSFECLREFRLEGSTAITCSEGTWSSKIPHCIGVCPDLVAPRNGILLDNNFDHGALVYVDCDQGYTMDGPSLLICNRNGTWSSELPVCRGGCPDLVAPQNGHRLDKNFDIGALVRFECNQGYTRDGPSVLICNRNGTWSSEPPVCKAPCPKLQHPKQGRRKGDNFAHRGIVEFFCYPEFELFGELSIRCNDGHWSHPVPRCEIPCDDPGKIENGRSESNHLTAEYNCDQGYSLEGPSLLNCVEGKWKPGPPRCLKDCDKPGELKYGRLNSTDFRHGKGVSYECLKGYVLTESTTITCSNGIWSSSPMPYCMGVCPHMKAPLNGKRLTNNFAHGARLTFKCNQGYTIDGPSILFCNKNGTWSSEPPVCKASCPKPQHPKNGKRKGENFAHRDVVDFVCDSGYELFGAQPMRCNDGIWSNPGPTCETGCSNLKIANGMTTQGNVDRSRSSMSFSCTPPLYLSGKSVLTCINGRWSDKLPVCSECDFALGMESGKIPNSKIRASSTHRSHHAYGGRLNGREAWCSGDEEQPYLQIDFGKTHRITGLATQGSAYQNTWVEKYTVTSNLAGSSFNMYREDNRDKVFIGNRDKGTIVRNNLRVPVVARKLRIYVKKRGRPFYDCHPGVFGPCFRKNTFNYACMQVEIYGCDLPSDCIVTGSRIVAKWKSDPRGGYIYYNAYLTSISARYWKVELENESHDRTAQKYFPKYDDLPFVLDIHPKHEELQVGTRVLAPWGFRYYTSTIIAGRDRDDRYRVRADDGDQKDFEIYQLRLLKPPKFCN